MNRHKFAEDNIGLLYGYFAKHKIRDEDIKGELALEFWRTIRLYKEGVASLSTYVYKVLDNKMWQIRNYNQAKKRTLSEGSKMYHLDYCLEVNSEPVSMSEIIGDRDKSIEQFECDDVIERLLPQLTEKQQDILKLIYAGYTTTEVAKISNCSRQNVNIQRNRIYKFARNQLYEEMME